MSSPACKRLCPHLPHLSNDGHSVLPVAHTEHPGVVLSVFLSRPTPATAVNSTFTLPGPGLSSHLTATRPAPPGLGHQHPGLSITMVPSVVPPASTLKSPSPLLPSAAPNCSQRSSQSDITDTGWIVSCFCSKPCVGLPLPAPSCAETTLFPSDLISLEPH